MEIKEVDFHTWLIYNLSKWIPACAREFRTLAISSFDITRVIFFVMIDKWIQSNFYRMYVINHQLSYLIDVNRMKKNQLDKLFYSKTSSDVSILFSNNNNNQINKNTI